MEKRYRVLRFISFIYKLLAVLILIGAIIGGILTAVGTSVPGLTVGAPGASTPVPGIEVTETASGSSVSVQIPQNTNIPGFTGVGSFTAALQGMGGPIGGLGLFIVGLLWALGLYAVGDFISLLVATEQNTRAGAEYNRQAALMMREVAKRLGGGTGALR